MMIVRVLNKIKIFLNNEIVFTLFDPRTLLSNIKNICAIKDINFQHELFQKEIKK